MQLFFAPVSLRIASTSDWRKAHNGSQIPRRQPMFSNRRLPPSEARRLQRHRAPRSPDHARTQIEPRGCRFRAVGRRRILPSYEWRFPNSSPVRAGLSRRHWRRRSASGFRTGLGHHHGQAIREQANIEKQVEELNREFIRGQKQRQTKIARTNAEFEMVPDDSSFSAQLHPASGQSARTRRLPLANLHFDTLFECH